MFKFDRITFRKTQEGDEGVINHNLEMMLKDMGVLIASESMGGNAQSAEINGERWPCVAANGHADPQTGKIVSFGNFQDIPKDIVEENQEFTLRVALDLRKGHSRIINFFGAEKFSQKSRKNIEMAIERYNSLHN